MTKESEGPITRAFAYAAIAVPILRWVARCWSVASMLLIGMFVLGGQEAVPFLTLPEFAEAVTLALFPVGVIIGLLVATSAASGRAKRWAARSRC